MTSISYSVSLPTSLPRRPRRATIARMGHIRISITLALLAAVAAGCAADTTSTESDIRDQGSGPPDKLTCLTGPNWQLIDLPHSATGYPILPCWMGGPDERETALTLTCHKAMADDEHRYACVEKRKLGVVTGVWYEFEGGAMERAKVPGAHLLASAPGGKVDGFALVYTGPVYEEHDCLDERSPMGDAGWCE